MTIKQFYLLCLIGVTFIGGMIMLLLWRQFKLKSSENKGMLFLALAMFSWTIVGVYKIYDPPLPSLVNAINDRILSAFSNLFVLASLPYFPSVFESIRGKFSFFKKPEQWVNNVFIFFTAIIVVFTLIDRNIESDVSKKMIIAFDSLISTVSISLVSYALYKSITRFWHDKWLKLFLLLMFAVLISTQITLPFISIFPSVLKPIYFISLLLLLIGLSFFNFISIAYFGMLNLEFRTLGTSNLQTEKNDSYSIEKLILGYDENKKHYFITLEFHSSENKELQKETVVSTKLLLPFANWILFSLAKKQDVKLAHSDLSTTKFRMVEFWNKDALVKITQDDLFINDGGKFDFIMEGEKIQFHNLKFLQSKFIVREAITKHAESFASQKNLISSKQNLTKAQLLENLVDAVFAESAK